MGIQQSNNYTHHSDSKVIKNGGKIVALRIMFVEYVESDFKKNSLIGDRKRWGLFLNA